MTPEYSDEDDIFEDEVLVEDEDGTEEVIIQIVKDCYYYYGVHAEDFKDLKTVEIADLVKERIRLKLDELDSIYSENCTA